MKKRILALLLALTLLVLGGCTVRDMVQVVGVSTTTLQELADAALSDETEAPESGDQFVTTESPAEPPEEAPQDEAAPADEVSETTDTVGEHTYYYDVDHVVLYLDTYGHLPENYITKDEARALGWEGGSVEVYQEGAAIGGDRFGNRGGLLPEETGRTYTECDINTLGGDPAARHSYRPAGRAGRHIVSGHSRHRQFTGSSAVGGHGHRGEGLRVCHAAAVGIFAVRVCVRRAEYGRRQAGARKKSTALQRRCLAVHQRIRVLF